MNALDEEKCQELVEKLCSSLGWSVRQAPHARYMLFNRDNRWVTFGQSMAEIVESLCDPSWDGMAGIAYTLQMPAGLQGCASPEELALKAEALL